MKQSGPNSLGKHATAPSMVPLLGWWHVAKRVVAQIYEDDVPVVAAGVAFFGFLSIFPAIAAFVILYGLVADPGTVTQQLEPIRDLVPGEVFDLLASQLTQVTSTTDSALGFGLLLSLGLAVWSSARGATALMSAMDIAYNESHRQGWIRPRMVALAFTVAGLLFSMLAIGLLGAVPAAVALLSLQDPVSDILLGARWILLAGIVLAALGLLYRYGPNRRRARVQWVTPGSIVATALWIVASWGFGRYVANLGTYNETFGALGAVVVLQMWLYLSAFIVCIGAELNAELEMHTDADTTVGRWRPEGQRDAYVADHTTPLPGSSD